MTNTSQYSAEIEAFMAAMKAKEPNQPEFLQAVQEVAESVIPFIEENPKYKQGKVLERMVEPERVMMFRVPWVDDSGEIQVNNSQACVNRWAPTRYKSLKLSPFCMHM